MRMRWTLRFVLGVSVFSASTAALAQSVDLEFACALQGAERAQACLDSVAERVSEREVDRAAALFVRVGALERGSRSVERAYARGERARVWSAILAIGQGWRDRGAPRAALAWYEQWRDIAKREATADVVAAVHTGMGQALVAVREPARAYDSCTERASARRRSDRSSPDPRSNARLPMTNRRASAAVLLMIAALAATPTSGPAR
jgi:hypothetical protein